MGEDEKVRKLPIKPRKNRWISESGKGIVLRPPTEEEKEEQRKKEAAHPGKSIKPSEPEILPSQGETLSEIAKEVDEWDLDRVEDELTRAGKEEGFLARLLGGASDQYEIDKLNKTLEKLKISHEIRELIISREIQRHKAKEMLSEAKSSLLQKQVLTHPQIQKLNVETEILKRFNEKLQKEIEKAQLEKRLEAIKQGKDLSVEEYSYDLRDFEHLKKEEPED